MGDQSRTVPKSTATVQPRTWAKTEESDRQLQPSSDPFGWQSEGAAGADGDGDAPSGGFSLLDSPMPVQPQLQRQEEESDEDFEIQAKCASCEAEESLQRQPEAGLEEGLEETLGVQAKLSIGQPGDRYEQEADSVAAQVMKMPDPSLESESLQRQELGSAEEDETHLQTQPLAGQISQGVQLKAAGKSNSNQASAGLETSLKSQGGKGQPLGQETRNFMESRFGSDLGGVRVHTDEAAVKMNREVGAKAFTHGQDIYFNSGQYNPGSSSGKELLAHELTHTHQQGGAIGKIQNSNSDLKIQHKIQAAPNNQNIIQGFDIGEATRNVKDFGKGGFEKAKGLGDDLLENIQDLGEDAFPKVVERFAPDLAALIQNGPGDMIRDELESGVKGWLDNQFGDLNIQTAISGFQESIGNTFSKFEILGEDDEESCGALESKLNQVTGIIESITENPTLEMLQEKVSGVQDSVRTAREALIEPVFDSFIETASGVLGGLTNFASTIWNWGQPVRDVLGDAWQWVLSKLGINGDGEGGILEFLKEKAAEVWAKAQAKISPIFDPINEFISTYLNPASLISEAIDLGTQLIEPIRWLWENKDNPNLIKDSHEEMGHTILPSLLSLFDNFTSSISSFVSNFSDQAASMGSAVLNVLAAVNGVPLPLIGVVQSVFEHLSETIKGLVEFFETIPEKVKSIIEFAEKVRSKIEPFMDVLTSIGIAIVNPGMIPVILTGQAWLALPECHKESIINFILDTLISLIPTLSSMADFGPIWGLMQSGVMGFLETLRSQSIDVKVTVSNKIAKILSGNSFDFVLGFMKGLLRGIWDGLTSPFTLIWDGLKAAGSILGWIKDLITQQPASKSNQNSDSPAFKNSAGLNTNGVRSSNQLQSESTEAEVPQEQREDITKQLFAMKGELEMPVNDVTENFLEGAKEVFSSSGNSEGLTYSGLMEKLGDLWSSVESAIHGVGGQLAQAFCDFMLQDEAEGQIGESVGWFAGNVAVHAIIAIFSAGTLALAKAKTSILVKLKKWLSWVGKKIRKAFSLLGSFGRKSIRLFDKLSDVLNNVGGPKLKKVLNSIKTIGEVIIDTVNGIASDLDKARENGQELSLPQSVLMSLSNSVVNQGGNHIDAPLGKLLYNGGAGAKSEVTQAWVHDEEINSTDVVTSFFSASARSGAPMLGNTIGSGSIGNSSRQTSNPSYGEQPYGSQPYGGQNPNRLSEGQTKPSLNADQIRQNSNNPAPKNAITDPSRMRPAPTNVITDRLLKMPSLTHHGCARLLQMSSLTHHGCFRLLKMPSLTHHGCARLLQMSSLIGS
ncbi:eCIS core domain-containing protein [Sodalinema gerasimenkoae]|uniref:eCIS core domain-containing protein n=1 Tax=Sodalinema gerasimenkoae TaxID=2862348 RepID=UPI001CA55535|nr:DUF4157 domain-containing protein [Sodalinema gerasimenkoae]